MDLQIIIFSYNRAIQLNTLLSSLFQHLKGVNFCVEVIYNVSSEEYSDGYKKLINKFESKSVSFYKESEYNQHLTFKEFFNIYNFIHYIKLPFIRKPKTNFRDLLLSLLRNNTANEIMFLTDDSVFIRDVELTPDVLKWIEDKPTERQFSLRLGMNINMEPKPKIQIIDGEYIEWKFSENLNCRNWGYSFSVDGHIYNKKKVLDLLKSYLFVNPNTLESYISSITYRKKIFNIGKSYVFTSILSFPINIVQTMWNNPSLGVSTSLLNKYFLEGYSLRYPIPQNIETFQQFPSYIEFIKNNNIIRKYIKSIND